MSTWQPKPRSKTFTGCWTCRARKVKCDLGRPSCKCCTKGGRICQGYGIPLYWVQDDETVSPSVLRRQTRSLALGNPHWSKGIVKDVDAHLLELQQHEPLDGVDDDVFMSGPFGVFNQQFGATRPGRTTENPYSTPPIDRGHDANTLSVKDEASRQSLAESDQVQSLTKSRPASGPSCYAAGLQHDILIDSLLRHYLETVANILQPVRHHRNAYSSIYGSRAMLAAKKLSWSHAVQHLQHEVSDCNVALLFSLLASSSFHLRESDRLEGADATARFFRTKAIAHLRLALSTREALKDRSDLRSLSGSVASSKAVLSVILTLVTADVLDGQMNEFWIHLDAAQALVAELRDSAKPGSSGEHLINICAFLQIMSDSTNTDAVVSPWIPGQAPQTAFMGGLHSLEFTYGVTARLVDLLHRATLLARNRAYYTLHGLTPPMGFAAACDDLWRDLQGWDISQEPLPSFPARDDVTALLASKHILAFAAGVLIYFCARVSPCGDAEMSRLVRCVATHLTGIEAIKRRTGYNATPTAVILWPGFIASSQASITDRGAWTRWWADMHDYHIGNIRTLWLIVQKSWKWRDASIGSLDDASWTFILRRDARRILAI